MDTDGTQIKTSTTSGNPSNPYAAPQTEVCQQKVDSRPYYTTPSFWASAVFGWFLAACLLSWFAMMIGLLELGGYNSIAVGVIIHLIAAFVGLFDARWRWNQNNKKTT
jgi:ABC-type uncharacterized transport system permease subunit